MKFWIFLLAANMVVKLIHAESEIEEKFTHYYEVGSWGGDSKSGVGSDMEQTETIRREMPALLERFNCQVMVDASCGDFYWMRHVDLPVSQYIGVDIVKPMILVNQKAYGDNKHSFLHLDISRQMVPKADIILCRDALIHLSYKDIDRAIKLFKKSGSKYLLTTSFLSRSNYDVPSGEWHPINLMKPPFNFPKPLVIMNENCTEGEGAWSDKSLLLWKLSDLPNWYR
ncbi:MAG: hypothetical protein K1000chlam3_01745 [Chlamydiae bacterium]|nr:hypothetical protein [Chlamydiota bacterium]